MICDHELTGDPDEGDSGGSAIMEMDDGTVKCCLCNQIWVKIEEADR